MKHSGINSRGSFVAWGTGLEYEYDAQARVLGITDPARKKPLLHMDFDSMLSSDPLSYVRALDKTTKINALVFSNNSTVNLSAILEEPHLRTMIETSAALARCSYDLAHEQFERFEEYFCQNYLLSRLQLEKLTDRDQETRFYRAELETRNRNRVLCRSSNLYAVINKLSKKTARDLTTMEYGYRSQRSAQNLLVVSSNLSVISKILNKNFIPEHRIRHISRISGHIATPKNFIKNIFKSTG